MQKHSTAIFILSFALIFTHTAAAQVAKTITLGDGTTVRGVITSISNGTYTVETENLGTLQIKDSSILSITAGNAAAAQNTGAAQNAMANPGMMNQMQMLQGTIMSDPALMQEIQKLLENPNVLKAMSDQQFLNDVMSYDAERIQNNPHTQALINDPAVQRMMELMGQKFGGGQIAP